MDDTSTLLDAEKFSIICKEHLKTLRVGSVWITGGEIQGF